MLDLPPVPPLRSPSSPQLKASPLPDPTRPKKRALCPSPHRPPGLCMLNSLSSPVLELALNGKSLAGKKRKLLKAPGFQQEARPSFSSETLRDLCSPAPVACRQGQDHKRVSARPSLSPDVVVLKQVLVVTLVQSKAVAASSPGGFRVTAGNQLPRWTDPEDKYFPRCRHENILPATMIRRGERHLASNHSSTLGC